MKALIQKQIELDYCICLPFFFRQSWFPSTKCYNVIIVKHPISFAWSNSVTILYALFSFQE